MLASKPQGRGAWHRNEELLLIHDDPEQAGKDLPQGTWRRTAEAFQKIIHERAGA